jgi:hypothetical protein
MCGVVVRRSAVSESREVVRSEGEDDRTEMGSSAAGGAEAGVAWW